MKKYILILAALATTVAFAQFFPEDASMGGNIMSGEAFVFNSAPIMSGEPYYPEYPIDDSININLPFDPSEEDGDYSQFNVADDYQFPPYSLNSAYSINDATRVKTGPEAIILFIIAMTLGFAFYGHKMRAQKQE